MARKLQKNKYIKRSVLAQKRGAKKSRPRVAKCKRPRSPAPSAVLKPKAPPKHRPGSKAYNQRMRDLGLVPPQPTRSEFIKQQNKYYDLLAKEGFKDLEYMDRRTGQGQNADYLAQSSLRARAWRPEKAQFYRLLRNYVTHVKQRTKLARETLKLLVEGISYRKALKHVRRKCGYRKSLYSYFYYCENLLSNAMRWNVTGAEGMLNPANQDSWADDALIKDLGLTQGTLGLPLDYGWLNDNVKYRKDN